MVYSFIIYRTYNTSFMRERMKIIDSKGCFSIMLFRPSPVCVCVYTRGESTRQSYYNISDGKTYAEGCAAPIYIYIYVVSCRVYIQCRWREQPSRDCTRQD